MSALLVIAYLGGVFTIVSPCVLPVAPLVLARPGVPFRRGALPILAGMVLTFALVAAAAAFGGDRIARASSYGRLVAMGLLAIAGCALLAPSLAARLSRPLVAAGARVQPRTSDDSILGAVLIGVSTGFLWAPCAGPVLGLILTTSVVGGASARTAGLLLAFAAGAASSLALAVFAGEKVYSVMKSSLAWEAHVKRALGILVLASVAVVALGWDTGVLATLSVVSTASVEQRLVDRYGPRAADTTSAGESLDALAAEERLRVELERLGEMPELAGGTAWLNSPPLTRASLRGKVVLVDFWTFGCYNCRNALPHVKEYYRKYKERGLVVVGVHTPEFAYEKVRGNVEAAIRELGIEYPVVMDNDYRIWNAFHNQYWPAAYYVDATGQVRFHQFGEGRYEEQDLAIRRLLEEVPAASGK
jgi:cytochrome c biogenesis protein CcdA/thiol-disulfide isomerase/thioredoxin